MLSPLDTVRNAVSKQMALRLNIAAAPCVDTPRAEDSGVNRRRILPRQITDSRHPGGQARAALAAGPERTFLNRANATSAPRRPWELDEQ
jgi:hypothetical protein